MRTITPGRQPTLGEALDYYTSSDFLNFLLHELQTTRIVSIIPKQKHWEPNWNHDEIKGTTITELEKSIVDRISQAYPNITLNDTPTYYPSFHRSVLRQVDLSNPSSVYRDCIFESDLPTWRDSFRDVGTAIHLMDEHGVRYRHKFSGHRSLHIVIPAEIIPHGYRGKGTQKLAQHIARWSNSAAHHLPKITRMLYSLNEDTGLVCMPIPRGGLPSFRPWTTNIHLVRIDMSVWEEKFSDTDAEATRLFIEAIEHQVAYIMPSYFIATWQNIPASSKLQLKQKSEAHPDIIPWSQLAKQTPINEETLISDLDTENSDLRWLTLEAYLLHGKTMSESTMKHLLTEGDEYGSVTATDILLNYEKETTPYLVKLMKSFEHYSESGARAALLLTLSDSLRKKVLDLLVADTGKTRDAVIISACLAGTIANDWNTTARLLEPLKRASDLSNKHQNQCTALEMLQDMGGWNRKQGAQQADRLAALGPDITDLLLLAAGSPDRRLRRDITGALATLADPRSVDYLVHALGDEYSKVRRKAISALVRIGKPAVEPLIDALGSDQPQIRGFAATALGQIRDPEAKDALLALLGDEDENVRRRVYRSLKDIATEDDIPRLLEAMETALPEHAANLVETLSALGEPARTAVRDFAVTTKHPIAAYFLAVEGDPQGREILVHHLQSEDVNLVSAAVELLTQLRDPRVVPFLAHYLQTITHWRAMWYANALGEIGTPDAVDALIAGLDRDYMLARRGAVRGLSIARDPRAVPHLIQALSDEDGKIRSLVGEALLAIGAPSIIPLQRTLAEDSMEAKRRMNRVKHLLEKLNELYPNN